MIRARGGRRSSRRSPSPAPSSRSTSSRIRSSRSSTNDDRRSPPPPAAPTGGRRHRPPSRRGPVARRTSFAASRGPVLRGVSFEIRPGESYGLVGESGCGKSTTAYAAVRYLPRNAVITGGRILVGGDDVTKMTDEQLRRSGRTTCRWSTRTRGRPQPDAPRSGRRWPKRSPCSARAARKRRRMRSRALRAGPDRGPGAGGPTLSASAVGRDAAARGHRHRARLGPEAAGARRADDRARRDGRGERPRPRPDRSRPRRTPRSCSSPTTSGSSGRCAIGSASCTPARSSRRATPRPSSSTPSTHTHWACSARFPATACARPSGRCRRSRATCRRSGRTCRPASTSIAARSRPSCAGRSCRPVVELGDGRWTRCHHRDRLGEIVEPPPVAGRETIHGDLALTLLNVSKTFHQSGHDVPALVKVGLELFDGETLGVVGESGLGQVDHGQDDPGHREPRCGQQPRARRRTRSPRRPPAGRPPTSARSRWSSRTPIRRSTAAGPPAGSWPVP